MRGLVVIPAVDCVEETLQTVADALAQLEEQAKILLIDQGSGAEAREAFECLVQDANDRVRLWQHHPPLPSLAATWNLALDYAWECGHTDCMVWNNDIRVGSRMYAALRAVADNRDLWFASPVNVAKQADPNCWRDMDHADWVSGPHGDPTLGGPDFSCFLITRECHTKYRFDERFQPAYHEDGDYHRRMWLGGDGARIAGVTLPYLHYGSRTIAGMSAERQRVFAAQFSACRARYVTKWGGEPHHERKMTPDSREDFDGVGTPGGYLSEPPPMLAQYPKFHCPMNEQGSMCVCGAGPITDGREWCWGTRHDGTPYNGCDFCTGYMNGDRLPQAGRGHRQDADNVAELYAAEQVD